MPARSRFPWKPLAIGGVVLGGVGIAVLASHRSTSPPKHVALIGDSYAVGLGPELAKLLPALRGEGHVGAGSAAWANHTAACGQCGDWLTAFKPDIVLVSLGINDGPTPNPANYQTIVRSLHGIGARVVWIEPPASIAAPAVRDVIASLGVITVPAPSLPMANSIHPTAAGYQIWASNIVQTLGRNDLLPLRGARA